MTKNKVAHRRPAAPELGELRRALGESGFGDDVEKVLARIGSEHERAIAGLGAELERVRQQIAEIFPYEEILRVLREIGRHDVGGGARCVRAFADP